MSCEAWKWLAIATGSVATAGYIAFELRRDLASGRYFVAWGTTGLVSLVAVIVYVVHCT